MIDDDRPLGPGGLRQDAAQALNSESLDSYSLDELDQRVALLQGEIARVTAHRTRAAAHRLAADALFSSKLSAKPSGNA